MAPAKKKETDAKGIPLAHGHPAGDMSLFIFYPAFSLAFLCISMAIAYFGIFSLHMDAATKKIAILAEGGFGWVYLGAYVIKLGQLVNGIYLGTARCGSKVGLPDQHVYKVMGAAGSSLGYVLMETEGPHGTFNRAQRAVQNYNEQYPQFMLYFLLASFVFPFPAFCLASLWAVAKVIGTIGYVSYVDGRMTGTMLSMILAGTMEALVLIAGYKAIQ